MCPCYDAIIFVYITVASENLFRRLSPGMDLNQTWYSYGIMDINDMIKKANVEVSRDSIYMYKS